MVAPKLRLIVPALLLGLLLASGAGASAYYDTVMADNPVAYWRLDETTGTQAIDEVSGRIGDIVGGVTLNQPSGLNNDPANPSMNFRTIAGADGVVRVPYDAALNPESFSIELWAMADGNADNYRSPFTNRGRLSPPGSGLSGQRGFLFYASSSNTWQFWMGTGGGWTSATGPAVELGEWVHLVGTFEATSGPDANGIYTGIRSFYVDGQLVASGAADYLPGVNNNFHIGAGGDSGVDYDFYGGVDDVALYGYTLTPDQVAHHHQAGVPEPCTMLLLGSGLACLAARRRRR